MAALEPVTATINTIGLAKNAPRPHAAMLFLDFLLSKKGQKIVQVSNYLPRIRRCPLYRRTSNPAAADSKRPITSIRMSSTIRATNGWTIFRTSS